MERELWESVYVLAKSYDRSSGVFYKGLGDCRDLHVVSDS